jgi:hypothetical protein
MREVVAGLSELGVQSFAVVRKRPQSSPVASLDGCPDAVHKER